MRCCDASYEKLMFVLKSRSLTKSRPCWFPQPSLKSKGCGSLSPEYDLPAEMFEKLYKSYNVTDVVRTCEECHYSDDWLKSQGIQSHVLSSNFLTFSAICVCRWFHSTWRCGDTIYWTVRVAIWAGIKEPESHDIRVSRSGVSWVDSLQGWSWAGSYPRDHCVNREWNEESGGYPNCKELS